MSKEITVKEALALPGAVFVDVRSESEFHEASIPGAVNRPLLHDDERAAVGTVYKHQGAGDARQLGLDFVSARLPGMVREYEELSRRGPLVLYCWRGGMRSKSVCSLLNALGIPAYRLVGGYKAYRRFVNEYLSRPLPHKVAVLHGLTGVGKTEILRELRRMEAPAVDLEGLANNRGSVFGQIGMQPQPTQKMFDSLLFRELVMWEPAGYIIVECESRRIGRIILPGSLVEAMKDGVSILVYCSMEARVERIKRIYAGSHGDNREQLKAAIMSLSQRLGKKRTAEFCEMVDNNRLDEVVEYLLVDYYDPLYQYPSGPNTGYDFCIDSADVLQAATGIKQFLADRFPDSGSTIAEVNTWAALEKP